MMFEIWYYLTEAQVNVFDAWSRNLRDSRAEARITFRLDRLAKGSFGDCKPVGEGVWELRIDYGPGYRIYYAMHGNKCVLLLCGGDKKTQSADISRAKIYWKDFQRRRKNEKGKNPRNA